MALRTAAEAAALAAALAMVMMIGAITISVSPFLALKDVADEHDNVDDDVLSVINRLVHGEFPFLVFVLHI